MEVTINRATPYDFSKIYELLVDWFKECACDLIPKPCNYSTVWLADLIAKHIVLIAKVNEKVVGTIGLRLTYFPWNNEVQALTDDFLMTDKEYRHLKVADKLIEAAKKVAVDLKFILMMGHFSGLHAELKDKYFSKFHGFKYLGGNFIYNGE